MSRLLRVTANDEHILHIEFEHGNKVLFDMKKLIKTLPYKSLGNLENFKKLTIEKKAIIWPDAGSSNIWKKPIMLTVDDILFAIRE